MQSLNPYIDFSGRCREALDFYAQCFGGEVVGRMTYGEANIDVPAAFKHSLIHAEFKAPGIRFMASDGRPGQPVAPSSRIMLCLHCSDDDEQTRVFDALAPGGTVTAPLDIAFWGARFGMLVDRFGVHWMLISAKN